jgi:drug/metabolite transporter (DMT)-like permease
MKTKGPVIDSSFLALILARNISRMVDAVVNMARRGRTSFADSPLAVDAALLAVAAMWASVFTLFKIAWKDIDPVAFTGVRFAAMVVFSVGLLALPRHRIRPRRQDLPLLVASGLTGYFLYQMGFVLGLERTSALASAILISTHPIFSVVFMRAARRERPARNELVGVLVAFVGVAVFLRFWSAFGAARPGDLYSLGAAAAFGAYGVINQPLSARYPSRELMAYGLAVGGVLIALVAIPDMVRQDWVSVGAPAWTILVYAVIGPVYLAYTLWNWGIQRRGIPRTVVYGFLVPVLGGALAVIALDEPLRPEQVVGAVLVVAGLALTRLHAGRPSGPSEGEPVPTDREALPAR